MTSNTLFEASNHHVEDCGQPPVVDADTAGTYCGYFANEHGEQAIYVYDHATESGVSGQQCLPDELAGRRYYEPGRFGFEKEIRKRIEYWDRMRNQGDNG